MQVRWMEVEIHIIWAICCKDKSVHHNAMLFLFPLLVIYPLKLQQLGYSGC